MKHKFFSIPVFSSDQAEAALNSFCDQHRVVDIEKQLIEVGTKSCWAVCVTWQEHDGELFKEGAATKVRKPKVDYKEILNDEDFQRFSELRDIRVGLAQREGVAVYNIFTNEQLAIIVTKRLTTKSALLEIEGVGQTRVDKYADHFLQYIKKWED